MLGILEDNLKPGRRLTFARNVVTWAFALSMAVYQIWFIYNRIPELAFRGGHLAFGLALIFLTIPFSRTRPLLSILIDWPLAVGAVASGVYLFTGYMQVALRAGMPSSADIFYAILVTVMVLEATRRTTGWVLTLLALGAILYAFYGNLMPGMLWHRGHGIERITTHLFMSGEGIYGMPLGVSATFVFLFLLFAAVLRVTGGGKFFIDLAMAAMGTVRGGPAKVAVLASAMMGTISGTGTGNVAATGSITIPLMIANRYKPHVAGAIECAASTGGMLLPPMMGAAAFIIPEFIGGSYRDVMVAAILPAILYFAAVFFMVDLESVKTGAGALSRDQVPKFGPVLRDGWHFLLAVLLLVFLLVVLRMSPVGAALYAIGALMFLALARNPKLETLRQIIVGLRDASLDARIVVATCAVAGIVIGVVTLTGIGIVFSGQAIALAGDSLLLLLLLCMAASIILGMGIPPTGAYVIVAVLIAPAMIRAGVLPISAHLFVFYFAMAALITPPIAVAVFVAAGIAKANVWLTALQSLRFGAVTLFIPFLFVAQPALIMQGPALEVLQAFGSVFIGVYFMSVAFTGYFRTSISLLERLVLLVGATLLFIPGMATNLGGLAIALAVLLLRPLIWRSEAVEHAGGAADG